MVRLATKLGFDGFTALQASVQHDLANQLRPAAERIREPVGSDLVGRHLQLEQLPVAVDEHAVDGGRGSLTETDHHTMLTTNGRQIRSPSDDPNDVVEDKTGAGHSDGDPAQPVRYTASASASPMGRSVTADTRRRYVTWRQATVRS